MKCTENLLAWQIFVSACRTRSISQAAVLLDMDLPKASRLISGLERELGFELFDKSRRPIQPTPRAVDLREQVEPLLTGFQAVLEPRKPRAETLTIRFGSPIELAQEYFSDTPSSSPASSSSSFPRSARTRSARARPTSRS
ncbi:LysR family transcriptional regulator [Sutterella sp.]|uniref:helix-turn-helix domain-containing protein n=1 Tax=Sutterella sp. TaxID=1981025 RepID=UPI0026DEF4FC|nr:LysR family transcriptional regulator [Sutterella sp.]MDO5530894.1 LysR family transcriptional regulator [Sutterella sp.]